MIVGLDSRVHSVESNVGNLSNTLADLSLIVKNRNETKNKASGAEAEKNFSHCNKSGHYAIRFPDIPIGILVAQTLG